MIRIATITEGNSVVGVVHGPDACDQTIRVRGRVWRFDFDRHCGVLWLRKDGQERKCQCPTDPAVWRAFERWLRKHKRSQLSPGQCAANDATSASVGEHVRIRRPSGRVTPGDSIT
jgi:hypothetical protein